MVVSSSRKGRGRAPTDRPACVIFFGRCDGVDDGESESHAVLPRMHEMGRRKDPTLVFVYLSLLGDLLVLLHVYQIFHHNKLVLDDPHLAQKG